MLKLIKATVPLLRSYYWLLSWRKNNGKSPEVGKSASPEDEEIENGIGKIPLLYHNKTGFQLTNMGEINFDNWEKQSEDHQKKYKQFLQRADKNKVLKQLPQLNEEAFEKVNCLNCAACCKSYSPRFKGPDIKRISKYLGMKETELIEEYMLRDDEGDYVGNSLPCPFLGEDNACGIYDVRPSDCARFPYTSEDVLLKRPAITQKNSTFCPIVFYVLEKLTE